MRIKDLISKDIFEVVNIGSDTERNISVPFCCDLPSIAISRAPADCIWITVMGNVNILAVAVLVDAAGIILAEDTKLDAEALNKAKEQDITVLKTDLPVFDAALKVKELFT